MEKNNYGVVLTNGGIPIAGDLARRIVGFSFVPGQCAADVEKPRSQPRSREWYLEYVINPMLAAGELDDGTRTPYDDRKLRVDGASIITLSTDSNAWSVIEVALGISHFKAFRADQNRTEEECGVLQQHGIRDFGDQWAYFQRNPGIAGLVLSKDGFPYVGRRTNKEMQGSLNATAGHLEYRKNVGDVNVMVDLYREMHEEFGVLPEDVVSTTFVGAFGSPVHGDFDFTYVVRTKLGNDHFAADGVWTTRRTKKEHEELIKLATLGEVQQLLTEGTLPYRKEKFQVMYSTRGALESLRENDFKKI